MRRVRFIRRPGLVGRVGRIGLLLGRAAAAPGGGDPSGGLDNLLLVNGTDNLLLVSSADDVLLLQ